MMVSYRLFLYPMILCLSPVQADSCKNAPDPIPYPRGSVVQNSQDVNSATFVGAPASAKILKPQFKFHPDASLMHGDGGNQGSSDHPGPLGIDSRISSSTNNINMLLWGPDGGLTCGYANISAGNPPPLGLVALNPVTLDVLAAWYPPINGTINLAYMEYVQGTNNVLVSTKEGHIYIIHRDYCNGRPYFTTIRTIALASALRPGEQLLNAMYDIAGNIWFTSGGISGAGATRQNSTTYGYITPAGKIVKTQMDNEMVENGIAVSGMDVYMVTGPSGTANTPNATGYMYSMTSDWRGSIRVRWRVPYDAGSGERTGVTSRGAGSTPTLLTNKYVAVTDKSDGQVHLIVYHQEAKRSKEQQLVCQIPLFAPGKSNNDNAIVSNFDGKTYGLLIQNDFKAPPLYIAQPGTTLEVNGEWNDMSGMAGGMVRIDINANGKCSLRWTSDLAVKAVSVLSTKTGLVYSYVQDIQRSSKGEYVWYVAGIDWDTGETIFRVRTGTGGTFNDNWTQGTVGPDGAFYQAVLGGVVAVKDKR